MFVFLRYGPIDNPEKYSRIQSCMQILFYNYTYLLWGSKEKEACRTQNTLKRIPDED